MTPLAWLAVGLGVYVAGFFFMAGYYEHRSDAPAPFAFALWPLVLLMAPFYFLGKALGKWVPVVALLYSSLPAPAHAQAPADGVFGAAKLSSWTWVQYVSSEGKDRVPSFGARLQGSVKIWRVLVAGRLDASGRSEGVDAENPRTYSSLEGYALGAVDVAGPVALAGVWGTTRPAFGDEGQERQTWGGGVLVGDGTGEAWLLAMVGRHEAAGEGLRPMVALQAPLRDRTSFVGDAVLGKGWQVRAGIAVRLR